MDKKNIITFENFAKKAAKKLEERKRRKTKTLYVGDLDENITIRGLSDQEFIDCSEYSDNSIEVDKYTLYYASPTLRDLAEYMVSEGMIDKHIDVCECINKPDRDVLIKEVINLSGILAESSVKELDEIKK